MTKLDWSKVKADDSRRRNAPIRQSPTRRFVMRSRHAGMCKACGFKYEPLDQITPVEKAGVTHWVHWTKSLRCARRLEANATLH